MTKQYTLFTQRVLHIIKNIPSGSIMTYGEVAALAGSPRAARQVVRILHTLSDAEDLPWHRVVNKDHVITIPGITGQIQQQRLEREGVFLSLEPRLPTLIFSKNKEE